MGRFSPRANPKGIAIPGRVGHVATSCGKVMETVRIAIGSILSALSISVAVGEMEAAQPPPANVAADDTLVYVGTYTGGESKGIYLFKLPTNNVVASQSITLTPLGLAADTPNPSFLEIDARRRLLFAVNEIDEYDGQREGAVSAFSIDGTSGKLTLLNQRSSRGGGPCHLILDRSGRHLLVANYGGGSVAVLPVAPDGRLGEATDFIQHSGSSVDPRRQRGPHAHCVTLDPANRFAFVCDLGLDKVLAYRFDAEAGNLSPSNPAFTALTPGAGPRHMTFHPDSRFAYVINELNSTITAYAYDAQSGALSERQTISTLPEHFDGLNTTAEIAVHPNGKYVYASNRGHESVVLFAIDGDQGTLTYVEDQGTGGKTPRHFGIQQSGEHLAITNQTTNTLRLCRIDGRNGRLKPSSVFTSVPSPTCVVFLPPISSNQ
jgi:6-phosphogluconolactonase